MHNKTLFYIYYIYNNLEATPDKNSPQNLCQDRHKVMCISLLFPIKLHKGE
jgi:hypothetical protein